MICCQATLTGSIRLFTVALSLLWGSFPMTAALGAEALPQPQSRAIGDGWMLRTGVLPKFEAKATLDAKGVLTIEGGGEARQVPHLLPPPAEQPHFTSAFVYRNFTGDFIITGRRTRMEKGSGHENAGSGLAAIGDLSGSNSGVAVNSAGAGRNGKPFNDETVWFRMIRKGDRVGLYEGPDGQMWEASQGGAVISGPVHAGFYTSSWGDEGASKSVFDSITVIETPTFTYSTTWLANEFEGGVNNTVNSNMISLAVSPDGMCYTGGMYGEQEICLGRYKDGKVFTKRAPQSVGDPGAMTIVPGTTKCLYIWENCVGSFEMDNESSRGKSSDRIGTSIGHDSLRGIAVLGQEIFVASRPDNMIYVLDLENRKVQRKIPFTRPGPLAVDAKGVLWAVEEGWVREHACLAIYDQPFRLLGLDPKTGKQVAEISGIGIPSALCADDKAPSRARLLVADNGPDQQVKLFDVGGKQPKAIGTLGAKGGVYAGTPGQMKDGKFHGITGVGTDAKGNIYTTTNGYPYRVAIPHSMPAISQLKAFAPTAIDKPDPEALWSLHCTAFNIMGSSYDPATQDVYVGGLARYAYDAKRGLGREWQLAGLTSNPRVDSGGSLMWRTFMSSPDIRRIDGQPFLFLSGCASGGFTTYRLDANGNLGVPCHVVGTGTYQIRDAVANQAKDAAAGKPVSGDAFPTVSVDAKNKPTNWTAFDWLDGRGGNPIDGKRQVGEYLDLSKAVYDAHDGMDWRMWFDSKGGIWYCHIGRDRICYQRCTGVKDGVPQYDPEVKTFPIPKPFTRVMFLSYDPDRDVMVISGASDENKGDWLTDAEAIRYTNWSTKPVAGERILYMPPYTGGIARGEGRWRTPHMIDKPVAWAVAGDVLYATNRTGTVRAYDLIKGNLIAWMDPGPEVLGIGGYFEGIHTGVRAFDVGNGEHLVLRQSNNTIRIIAHRLKPGASDDKHLPPAPEPWARAQDGKVELLWGGRTGSTGTVKGYKVYRSDSENGAYTQVGGLVEHSSYLDALPNGTAKWYTVATVNLAGEGPQSTPVFAGAAAPAATLRASTGKSGADGLDVTTRGNWQGVYGAAGVYLACDQIKKGGDEKLRRYSTDPNLRIDWPWFAMYSGEPAASDDADRLQSVFPGMRTGSGGWYNTALAFNILDGQPRTLTIAMESGGKKQVTFRDPDSNRVILDQTVQTSPKAPKTVYVSFIITGRLNVQLNGEPFLGFFIDPPANK